ncbi:hypothetical protein [Streptomyces sp. cmx-18-6]|uniref:hypothetical protein n=1 Tax=Streptomyces sp. cmx-18-6 TaxID=2790930 RepID=UPI00397FB7F0
MSASYYRSRLDRKNRARADAERKAGEHRRREADKRSRAARERAAAARSKNPDTVRGRLSAAARYESQAGAAGRDAVVWSSRAARLGKEAALLEAQLARAQTAAQEAADRARRREQRAAERRSAERQKRIEDRMASAEEQVGAVLKEIRAPKPEKLRLLMLGASSDGDLRVAREQERIRTAVRRALHRDLVEMDAHPAATAESLLDGLTQFRPHVVHFSGHSTQDLIVFEQDVDQRHEGAIITAGAFARAIGASDDPPLLVVLNSCHSAAQTKNLLDVVPFAIGMSDSIGDTDAITYAARFYAAVADGQSIQGAHALGRTAVELAGLTDHDLPTLDHADDVDPRLTRLVTPPPQGP